MLLKKFLVTLFLLTFLTACGETSTLQDLEGVHAVEPNLIQVYYNINGHPNVGISCPNGPNGFGYMTTTRDLDAVEYLSECPISEERGKFIKDQGDLK